LALIGPKADPDGLLPNGVPEPRPFPLGTIAYGRLFEYLATNYSRACLAKAYSALALSRFKFASEAILA
jgi:hypothetical protein